MEHLSKKDFLAQSKTLFFNDIRTVKERIALFTEVFLPAYQDIFEHIIFEDSIAIFWPRCIDTLLRFPHHPPNHPNPLVRLLKEYNTHTGQWETLQRLEAAVPHLCAQAQQALPTTTKEHMPLSSPHIYLCYTPQDKPFANKVQNLLVQQRYTCTTSSIIHRGSDQWLVQTTNNLNQATLILVIIGPQTASNHWLQLELLAARDRQKHIRPLLTGPHPLPANLPPHSHPIQWQENRAKQIIQDITSLIPRLPPPPAPTWQIEDPDLKQRLAERFYMDYLKLAELNHILEYTRLEGETRVHHTRTGQLRLNPVAARHHFIHQPWQVEKEVILQQSHHFEDAVSELQGIRRAMLLGDPGSGKTTTLYKVAADLIETALQDPTAPIPLMIRLGNWCQADEPFEHFLKRSLAQFAPAQTNFRYLQQPAAHLQATLLQQLAHNRVALLLDGLNELPAQQHATKYAQLNDFIRDHSQLMVLVSCREQDYPPDRRLNLDTVTVAPLDAVRVHEFIRNYLAKKQDKTIADTLFWQLTGDKAQQTYQAFFEDVGQQLTTPFATFWLQNSLPHNLEFGYKNGRWQHWLKTRTHPASLLRLAYNPFMLYMLVQVYRAYSYTLPANRGQLFDRFVDTLLAREGLLLRQSHTLTPDGASLLRQLTTLAYAMQAQRAENEHDPTAMTTLPLETINQYLTPQQQYQATSANLLTLSDEGRFSHQLLQEYFVARAMQERILDKQNPLPATDIWPPHNWWQPTNWEEATILLAGLYSDDCTPIITWIAEANPELAARCITESGAFTPDSTKRTLRQQWLPRLTNLNRDPHARAAIGRALGRLTLSTGEFLDNRPGVGFTLIKGQKIPDIVWGETVPMGRYVLSEDKDAANSIFPPLPKRQVKITHPYQLAIYPITLAQFQCFVEADFHNPRWWQRVPSRYQFQELRDPQFNYNNHPRDSLSWYQAVAFGRWLSHVLGYEVRLPHEDEWEVAARYSDGRFYPWGNAFDEQKANTDGDIGQTTAVGLYPNGRQPQLNLYDMSGNVWEWCQNKYRTPEDSGVDASGAHRVLRGGSWDDAHYDARAACRNLDPPYGRYDAVGCRFLRHPPS